MERIALWSRNPISEIIVTAGFKTHIQNVTLIQCYAPTEATEKNKKEYYY
jgi:hypothetical protein